MQQEYQQWDALLGNVLDQYGLDHCYGDGNMFGGSFRHTHYIYDVEEKEPLPFRLTGGSVDDHPWIAHFLPKPIEATRIGRILSEPGFAEAQHPSILTDLHYDGLHIEAWDASYNEDLEKVCEEFETLLEEPVQFNPA